jgi:hypothetical protein
VAARLPQEHAAGGPREPRLRGACLNAPPHRRVNKGIFSMRFTHTVNAYGSVTAAGNPSATFNFAPPVNTVKAVAQVV